MSPVAAGSCASVPRLSSPATTPRVSSSACSGWLPRGCVPGTSASARRGPALLSSCGARRLPLQRCCSSRLLALHAGSFPGAGGESGASPATAGEQHRVEMSFHGDWTQREAAGLFEIVPAAEQEASSGAAEREEIGEPEGAGHLWTGEAGGCGRRPIVVVGCELAAGRRVELGTANAAAGGGDGEADAGTVTGAQNGVGPLCP